MMVRETAVRRCHRKFCSCVALHGPLQRWLELIFICRVRVLVPEPVRVARQVGPCAVFRYSIPEWFLGRRLLMVLAWAVHGHLLAR